MSVVKCDHGKGNLTKTKTIETNFCIRRDSRSIEKIQTKSGSSLYLITQNRDSLIVYERNTNYNLNKPNAVHLLMTDFF
jgi:hypothetical protein